MPSGTMQTLDTQIGHRLDRSVADSVGVSRRVTRELIREGEITVNGNVVTPGYMLKQGDTVTFNIPDREPQPEPTTAKSQHRISPNHDKGALNPKNYESWDLEVPGTDGIRPLGHDHVVLIGDVKADLYQDRQRVGMIPVMLGDFCKIIAAVKQRNKAIVAGYWHTWGHRSFHFPTVQIRWEEIREMRPEDVILMRVFRSEYKGQPRYNFMLKKNSAGYKPRGIFVFKQDPGEEDLCEAIHFFAEPEQHEQKTFLNFGKHTRNPKTGQTSKPQR